MTRLMAATAILVLLGPFAYGETEPAEQSAPDGAKTAAAAEAEEAKAAEAQSPADPEGVDWSKVDWRKKLTRLQYHILREAGTERAFTGKYWDFFKPGEYRCAGCGLPLFESDAKFESDCGWPSFDRPISDKTLTEQVDFKIGYPRTEIRCRRCESHLGHVFNDGPTETGLRYCLNSAAMKFVSVKQLKAEQTKPGEKAATPAKEIASKEGGEQPAAAAPSTEGGK